MIHDIEAGVFCHQATFCQIKQVKSTDRSAAKVGSACRDESWRWRCAVLMSWQRVGQRVVVM